MSSDSPSPVHTPPPEDPPPKDDRSTRWIYGITKAVFALLSLAAIAFGALWAYAEDADGWYAASGLAVLGVIAVAIRARVRWSILVLFASMLFGLASCFANFKWHGG